MKWELVIFDLDGTVLDTIQDLGEAVNYAFSRHGQPKKTLSEFRMMAGNGIRNLVSNALPENLRKDEAILSDFVKQFTSYYKAHICDNTKPYDGMPELISDIIASGATVAIASNKFQEGVEFLTRKFYPGIDIIYGERPGVPLKPDPACINMIISDVSARKGEIDRSRCVLIGDATSDIQAAATAGISGIGVSWGIRPVSMLLEMGVPEENIAFSVAQLRTMLL